MPHLRPSTHRLVEQVVAALTADGVPFVLVYDPDKVRYTVASHLPDGCDEWAMASWLAGVLTDAQEREGHRYAGEREVPPEPVRTANRDG